MPIRNSLKPSATLARFLSAFAFLLISYYSFCQSSSESGSGDGQQNESFAEVRYSAYYKLNMINTSKIYIALENTETGERYWPSSRKTQKEFTIRVPEGEYRLSRVIIKQTGFPKCIAWYPEGDTYLYGHTDNECSKFNKSGLVQGGILTGDKIITADATNFALFEIEASKSYNAGKIALRGKVHSMFDDLPNLIINQSVPTSDDSNGLKLFNTEQFIIDRPKKSKKKKN